jgi:DNA-binding winged helix-turn-helix (wHTH) protein/tetratricopeptide (TPR) repeat protein
VPEASGRLGTLLSMWPTPSGAREAGPESAHRARAMARYRFGQFEIDLYTAELRRDGALVAVTSLSFQLLGYLLLRRERVVTSDELLEAVWADVTVTSGSVRQAIFELRRALDDRAEEPRLIRTVRGRGYQFVAAVHEVPTSVEQAPAVSRATGSFFGRAHELARLTQALEDAGRGSGRCCVLSGPPGIGKSRLACELATRAKSRQVGVLEGWSDPDGRTPPLWPWLQMLTSHLRALAPSEAAALQAAHPVIRRLLVASSKGVPAVRVEADAAKQLRTDLLRDLGEAFVAIMRAQPLLLLLEDAQWADEASLALLGHMASLQSQTRALLLVTHRDVPMREHRPLARALTTVKRGPLNEQLTLERLGAEEVAQLLAAHMEEVTPTLAAEVYDISRGNPLFAAELARLLARTGARASLCDEQPRELRSVIHNRLSSLPDDVAEAARAASVLGNDFSLAELAGVLGRDGASVLALVDTCIALGVLDETALPTRFRFAHPLLRDALYETQPRADRVALHRQAGEWLETLGDDPNDLRASALAHHFHLAAPSAPDKAITYLLRSAECAYRATAYEEACRQYERARAVAELGAHCGEREKLEIALRHGEAMRAADVASEQVDRHFMALAERAEALGDARSFARAVLGYTGQRSERFTPTQFDAHVNERDVALLERARAALGTDAADLRVLLTCSLSFSLMCSTERARREQVAREAVDLARALEQPALIARALLIYARCSPECLRPEPKIAACSELIGVAYAHGLREQELEARSLRAVAHLSRGDVASAHTDEQRVAVLAQAIATPRAQARAQLLVLMRLFWSAQLAETEALAQRMLAASPLELAEQAMCTVRLAAVSAVRDGLSPGVVFLHEQLHARYPEGVGFRCTLASIRATLGDEGGARAHFEWLAEDDFRRIPVDVNWLSAMNLLADTAIHLGDARYAALVYERLVPHGDLFDFCLGDGCPSGPVAYWLAELATTMGRFDEARRWLSEARSLCARLEASLFHHSCALVEARLWLVSEPTRRARVRPLLDGILAFAEARGAGWLRARATHLLRQIETAPGSPISMVIALSTPPT